MKTNEESRFEIYNDHNEISEDLRNAYAYLEARRILEDQGLEPLQEAYSEGVFEFGREDVYVEDGMTIDEIDEMAMEFGNSNIEASNVAGWVFDAVFHGSSLLIEESFVADALYDLNSYNDVDRAIEYCNIMIGHAIEDRMIGYIDGGAMIYWEELAGVFNVEFVEVDEEYLYEELFVCDDCGWMMPNDERSTVEDGMCRECAPDEDEYGDDEDE